MSQVNFRAIARAIKSNINNSRGASIVELSVALLVAAMVVYLASAPIIQMSKLENQVDFQGQIEMAQQLALLKARNGTYIKDKLNLTPGSDIDKCFGGRGTNCTRFSINKTDTPEKVIWDKVQFRNHSYQATSIVEVTLSCTSTTCGNLDFTVTTKQDVAGGSGHWQPRDLKAGFTLPAAALGSRQEIDYSNCIGKQITGIDYLRLKAECEPFTGNNTCKSIAGAGPLATFGNSNNTDPANCQAPVNADCPNGMKNIGLADGQTICVDEMVCTDALSDKCSKPIVPPTCVPNWIPDPSTVCAGQNFNQTNSNCDSSTNPSVGTNPAVCPLNPCTFSGAIKWPDVATGACGNPTVNISTAPGSDGVVANAVLGYQGSYTAKCNSNAPAPSTYDSAGAIKTCAPVTCNAVPTNLEWSAVGVKSAVAGPGLDPVGPWPCQGSVNLTNTKPQAPGVLLSTQADAAAKGQANHNILVTTATGGSLTMTCSDAGPANAARVGALVYSSITCNTSACPAPQVKVKEIICKHEFAADTVSWDTLNEQSFFCQDANCVKMASDAKAQFCNGIVEGLKTKCSCAIQSAPEVCGIESTIKPPTGSSGDCNFTYACGSDTASNEGINVGGTFNTTYTCTNSSGKNVFYNIDGTSSEFLKKISDTVQMRVLNNTTANPQTKAIRCEAIPLKIAPACPLGTAASEVIASGSCAKASVATDPKFPSGVSVDVSLSDKSAKTCPSILNPGEWCANGILNEPNYCGSGVGSDYTAYYCAGTCKDDFASSARGGGNKGVWICTDNPPSSVSSPSMFDLASISSKMDEWVKNGSITSQEAADAMATLKSSNISGWNCYTTPAIAGEGYQSCTSKAYGKFLFETRRDADITTHCNAGPGYVGYDKLIVSMYCNGAKDPVVTPVSCPAMASVPCSVNSQLGDDSTYGSLPSGKPGDIVDRQDIWFKDSSCNKAISNPIRKCTCGNDGAWSCAQASPTCPSCSSFGNQGNRNYPDECVQAATCFVGGTLVTMADESKKKIEDVKVGELVKTYDELSSRVTISPIEEVQHHEEKLSTLYTFKFTDGTKVTSNDIHRYYLPEWKEYRSAAEIESLFRSYPNLKLLGESNKTIGIVDIDVKTDSVKLYNLHVQSPYDRPNKQGQYGHNYFANGVLVHNIKDQKSMCDIVGSEPNGLKSCTMPYTSLKAVCAIANGVTIDVDPAGTGQRMVYFHGDPASMQAWQDCYTPGIVDCKAGESPQTKTVKNTITVFGTLPPLGQCYAEIVGTKCIVHTVPEGPCADAPTQTTTYDSATGKTTTVDTGNGKCKNLMDQGWDSLTIQIFDDGTCTVDPLAW